MFCCAQLLTFTIKKVEAMRVIRTFLPVLLLTILFTACEKPLLSEDEGTGGSRKTEGNLKLSVYQLEQTDFSALTRTAAADVCTRLNFVIYDMEGTRLKYENQLVGDTDFGTTSFLLPEGNYQLVVIAHSVNKNPTTTNPAKVMFTNISKDVGYSDTFLYHTTVTIGEEPQTLALSLHRIVSLCRFVIRDAIPEGITRMAFTYTGGSGHFNAATGLGVTNSTQVVSYNVEEGQTQTQYDLYTFLHDTTGTIHLKVTAYDAGDNVQLEREFDVPMERNKVTWLTGDFFTGFTPTSTQTFTTTINIDNSWGGEQHLTY